MNQTTSGGCSSLWKAANAGFKNAVQVLCCAAFFVFHCVSGVNFRLLFRFAQVLIDARADINAYQENTTITPVYNACYRGHDEIAEILIQVRFRCDDVQQSPPVLNSCRFSYL